MTIADLKAAWRDLPDSTEIFFLGPQRAGLPPETRTVIGFGIERRLTPDRTDVRDTFNIHLEP